MIAGDRLLDTESEAIPRDLQQGLVFVGDMTDGKGPCVVANPTVYRSTGVDRKDVAIGKHPIRGWNAVNDLVIDRGADRPRKTAIALECRHATVHADKIFAELVNLQGRHTGLHH